MYKPVEEYSSFGGKITKLYYCVAEAARQLKLSYYQMIKIIQSGQKYKHKYYRYYYKDDNNTITTTPNYKIVQKQNNEIINQFTTITEASKITGIGRNIISRLIKSGEPDKWGCIWENLQNHNENLQK